MHGKIDSNLDTDGYAGLPLIVIDGKEVPWCKFGRMLMTYEGNNFKLEFFDPGDEIP